jgi:hypothetical protein
MNTQNSIVISSREGEDLRYVDEAIREAIILLNETCSEELTAVFLSAEEEKYVWAAGKVAADEGAIGRELIALDDALQQFASATSQADVEAPLSTVSES